MTQLNLQAQWRGAIEQIETGDRVLGGANGKINQIFTALGDRTEYLKLKLESDATTITAGAGLTGGGVLRDNQTLSLGKPSKITAT
ncbi:tail fiber protein, partial [Kingella kingae]|nr:tail fiber protein [Kingella kingae]